MDYFFTYDGLESKSTKNDEHCSNYFMCVVWIPRFKALFGADIIFIFLFLLHS